MLALGLRARAPLIAARALVSQFEFHARERRRILVGVQLGDVLVREDVPVITGAEGDTRPFGYLSHPVLVDRVMNLPFVGCQLRFLPFAGVVEPLMAPSDPHPRVTSTFELLEGVVGCRDVTGDRAWGLLGCRFHEAPRSCSLRID